MARDVDPYKMIQEVTNKEQALRALTKAAKAPNHAYAVEILIVAFGQAYGLFPSEVKAALEKAQ